MNLKYDFSAYTMKDYVAIAQGIFYLLTGVWALVSIKTFQMVTGPKTDLWLVKTVGVLVSVIGTVLILAGARSQITLEVFVLAVGSCLVLAAIDIIYVSKKVIAPVYLWDAAAELILAFVWIGSYIFSK